MVDWFRSWHGAPTDAKWVLIARKAGVTPAVASAVAWALFDHASQATPRGSVAGFDCEVYAAWGGLEDHAVAGVVKAMRERGMIAEDGRLTSWSKRQPEREDGSAERARAWRERKRTQANADERTVTHQNRTEQNRTEEESEQTHPPSLRSGGHGGKTSHGTRLPDGWKPSDAGRAFAVEHLGSGRRSHEELAKFTDHWRGKAGAAGRKADWEATWRNWCRKASEGVHARASPSERPSYLQSLIDATQDLPDDQPADTIHE